MEERGGRVPREGEIRPGRLAAVVAGMGLLLILPVPPGLTASVRTLAVLFLAAILSVVAGALPIFHSALAFSTAAAIWGVLPMRSLLAGFSEDFIVLIVAAFLLSRAVLRSGLGSRIALTVIARLGSSPIGILYGLFLADALIAPAFPSNTARSGVLYPVLDSLCRGLGVGPQGERRRLGSLLMMGGLASLSLSSSLWLTAMAANPAGAAIAAESGVSVSFFSWFLAAVPPVLAAGLLLPPLLCRVMRPEVVRTPEAPALARKDLADRGPLSRDERITASVFGGLVLLWSFGSSLGVDRTAAALAGLAVLLLTGVYRLEDLRKEGEALEIWIWFALLYTLSTELYKVGFMKWLGLLLAKPLEGFPSWVAFTALAAGYVLLHYLFVSQSAHLFALYGVFLGIVVSTGFPAFPAACFLLFATNFFSCLTPQGSSANVLFLGSGLLPAKEVYRWGGLVTLVNFLVFLAVGLPWLFVLS